MKRIIIATGILLASFFSACLPARAQDPVTEAIKEGVTKVIKAIDLQIQRMQTETIWLQNAQKTLENTLSKLKLQEISDWIEKQRKLYGDYYNELWKVKSLISTYREVSRIIREQEQLVEEYKNAWKLLKQDSHFTAGELEEMYSVYSGIVAESLRSIDQLMLVVNSFTTQMSDGKRLELIHSAGQGVEDNLTDLRQFNDRNFHLSLSRAKDEQDADLIKKLYGIE